MARPIDTPIHRSPTPIHGQVLRRIPAVSGEVAATAEGDRIIDDQDLLVVGRAWRMHAIHLVAEPVLWQPSPGPFRPVAALDRERQGHVPDQDVNLKAGALGEEAPEEATECFGLLGPLEIRLERDARVEVPSQEQD